MILKMALQFLSFCFVTEEYETKKHDVIGWFSVALKDIQNFIKSQPISGIYKSLDLED